MTGGHVLSIDPGLSTGVVLLNYDDTSVSLVKAWQFGGGLSGFFKWWNDDLDRIVFGHGYSPSREIGDWVSFKSERTTIIAEKFTARNLQGFSYTTDSLEPLRGEGALIALGLMPDYTPQEKRWRDPKLQYVVGGKDKADKKKRLHKFLKDSGFYVAPKDVGCSDADDVRSALGHGLAYLSREEKHRGVFDLITKWSETNAVA